MNNVIIINTANLYDCIKKLLDFLKSKEHEVKFDANKLITLHYGRDEIKAQLMYDVDKQFNYIMVESYNMSHIIQMLLETAFFKLDTLFEHAKLVDIQRGDNYLELQTERGVRMYKWDNELALQIVYNKSIKTNFCEIYAENRKLYDHNLELVVKGRVYKVKAVKDEGKYFVNYELDNSNNVSQIYSRVLEAFFSPRFFTCFRYTSQVCQQTDVYVKNIETGDAFVFNYKIEGLF